MRRLLVAPTLSKQVELRSLSANEADGTATLRCSKIRPSLIVGAIALALTIPGKMLAQQSNPDPPATQPDATSGPRSPQWRGLSVEEKLRYDARHLFEVDNLVYAGVGAALDQWRDRPSEWGQGGSALGERYASHVGQYMVQRSIMFPVQAIDHEDTRYFRSKRTSIRGRVGDAFLHTIWRMNPNLLRPDFWTEFTAAGGNAGHVC
jgi:hypothetical protein